VLRVAGHELRGRLQTPHLGKEWKESPFVALTSLADSGSNRENAANGYHKMRKRTQRRGYARKERMVAYVTNARQSSGDYPNVLQCTLGLGAEAFN
jgi:hypothetical protein